jgi:2-iminobutanoate/2-iminopropanoate deaminase
MEKIETSKAPKAIGPYSQGTAISGEHNIIFVSGQLPIDPQTGKMVEGGIREFTRQVLNNIESILFAGGSNMQQVVRMDIFLKDLKNDFAPMNEEYAKKIPGPIYPARQTVQVSELPLGSPIEISCIAYGERL